MLFLVFVLAIGFGFVALTLIRLSGGNEGEQGEDDGGPPWRRRGPRPPGPRPRPPEPAWWPEFEREFRAYVNAQGTRKPVTGVGS